MRMTYYRLYLACYSGDDYAQLVGGGQRLIKNLQVGDRVWGLSNDGRHLIEDEIMCIPHAGPTTLSVFDSPLMNFILFLQLNSTHSSQSKVTLSVLPPNIT